MKRCIMNKEWSYNEFNVKDYFADLNAHRNLFEEIINLDPKKILEVGTGSGSMSIFLSHIGYDVTAIDNNKKILENAKKLSEKLNGKVSFVYCNAFKLSETFNRNEFDVVFSQGFFEHFNDDEIRKLLQEQLKVGKIIIYSVPSNYYHQKDFGNERLLSPKQWNKILKGFNVEFIKRYGLGNKVKWIIIGLLKHPYPPILKPYHILIKLRS